MDAVDPVLGAMPLGFISLDREWRVTSINAAGEAVVGTTREELVGASYWEAFPANVDNAFGRTYRQVAADGRPQSVEAFYPEPLNEGPAEVLRGLDTAMAQLRVSTYARVAAARLERTVERDGRAQTRMRWSNAGHLPFLVIHPDGSLAALTDWQGDLLLGLDSTTRRRESVVPLDPGATVLLFTDGLIERRDSDLDTGMAQLRAAAAELADRPLDELCDELVQRLVAGRPEDDVALVAIRLGRSDRR